MESPRCKVGLKTRSYKGIEIDQCPKCTGMWLDHPELDQLEDTVLSDDEIKGMMMYARRESDISCPKCDQVMTTFNYHAYNLPIDFCQAEHGFWLDGGEEKRVLELMEKRTEDLSRTASAEKEWSRLLQGVGSRSFFDKVKGLWKG